MGITHLATRAHAAAVARGHFRTDGQGVTGHLAMIHTDIARAEAAVRYHIPNETSQGRPTGPGAHAADASIRLMTLSVEYGLPLEDAVHQRLYPDGNPDRLTTGEAAALQSQEMGEVGAATYAELCWDGHQVLASTGQEIADTVMRHEAMGLKPSEIEQATRDRLAALVARTYTWAQSMTQLDQQTLENLIGQIVAFDEQRS